MEWAGALSWLGDWLPNRQGMIDNVWWVVGVAVVGVLVARFGRPARERPAGRSEEPARVERRADPLAAYRAALRARLDTLPEVFRVRGRDQRALSDVFVEVALSEDGAGAVDEALWAAAGGTERMRLAEVMSLEQAHWTLLGDPGSGKTTLLQHLGIELLDDPSGPVPVFLRIAEHHASTSLAAALGVDPETQGALLSEIGRGNVVLLLDGLDEHPDREEGLRVVARFVAEAGSCKVILTSRPIGYAAPGVAFRELRLCPLTRADQHTLLAHWVDDPARVSRALDQMERTPRLRRIIENPLLLTLVGLVMLEDASIELVDRRSTLYRKAVEALLRGSYRRRRDQERIAEPALVLEALGTLAVAIHGREARVAPVPVLVRVLTDDGALSARMIPRLWRDAEAFLQDVAVRTGLLMPVPSARDVTGYAFPHRSVREFLAAVALANEIGQSGIGDVPPGILVGAARGARPVGLSPAPGKLGEVLVAASREPATWSEVLALTCGLLGEGLADLLVRRVAAEGNPELVQRVVAEAEAISSDTVFAALGVQAGQEEWPSRRDLLLGLQRLVEDPRVAVGLLERFAKVTTHGADLWFVYRQLVSYGIGGKRGAPPEVAQAASDAAERLWVNHRPVERVRALEALEPWWRSIQPGRFIMGEEDWELRSGPAHEVEIVGDYEILGVPVWNELYELFDPRHRADRLEGDGDRHPVTNLTWNEAMAFATWLGTRLPFEAEWEYAALAGATTPYWCGSSESDLARVAWYAKNSGAHAHPVGELPANPWGLHDVHGNVREWCIDLFEQDVYRERRERGVYQHDPRSAPSQPWRGARRVLRGGHFNDGADWVSARFRLDSTAARRRSGLRPVRVQGPKLT